MATKKGTQKVFNVTAIVKATVQIQISADNLNDAFIKASTLTTEDFIEFGIGTEHLDSDFGIQGVDAYPNAYNLKSNVQTI